EKRVGDFVRALILDGLVTAVHDLSDGGLAVALAEMAIASGIGAVVNQLNDCDPAALFFGEDQGRYILTVPEDRLGRALEHARQAGVSLPRIGTTGGSELILGDARPLSVSELSERHEGWFPRFMGERPAKARGLQG
ncbi:MAG: AIR synthase-related protein, partial [Propylenella sp.]